MRQYHLSNKKYIRICKDSGCVSANYNITEDYEDQITLIAKDIVETSGIFTHIKIRTNK